jgi:hypothetical protein
LLDVEVIAANRACGQQHLLELQSTFMFTPEVRARLRSELLEKAATDVRICAAAITGSAASEREDQWSDIDLAFGVVDEADMGMVLSDWTNFMYSSHSALHHLDVKAGPWIYRVFILRNTLQVDLAFVSSTEFRPLAPTFWLVFGEAREERSFPAPAPGGIIGYGWLYALHARSCIERGKRWQAEYMISGMRDNVLALACLRLGLPAVHGRGFDLLPDDVLSDFEALLVRHLDRVELSRAFRAATQSLAREIAYCDPDLARRLESALTEISAEQGLSRENETV